MVDNGLTYVLWQTNKLFGKINDFLYRFTFTYFDMSKIQIFRNPKSPGKNQKTPKAPRVKKKIQTTIKTIQNQLCIAMANQKQLQIQLVIIDFGQFSIVVSNFFSPGPCLFLENPGFSHPEYNFKVAYLQITDNNATKHDFSKFYLNFSWLD